MKLFFTLIALLGTCLLTRAALFTNSVSADAFVRSNAPAVNYGGAGALTISGATATNSVGSTNGIADSFLRFNTSALVATLNATFGVNNWVINGVTLRVVEMGAPSNVLFTRGKGAFEIRWLANDFWAEGTGMPTTPTTDGVTYNNEPTLLTNTVSLGVFTNMLANTTNLYSLALPSEFTSDINAGGDVSLYFTAADSPIGFTFQSQNFNIAGQRPILVISAVAPVVVGLSLSGSDVLITGINAVAGTTYSVLGTTNLLTPFTQWTRLQTNTISTSGYFELTLGNAVAPDAPGQQFFILQTK